MFGLVWFGTGEIFFSRAFVMVSGDGGVDYFEVLRIFKRRIQRKTGGHGNGEKNKGRVRRE